MDDVKDQEALEAEARRLAYDLDRIEAALGLRQFAWVWQAAVLVFTFIAFGAVAAIAVMTAAMGYMAGALTAELRYYRQKRRLDERAG